MDKRPAAISVIIAVSRPEMVQRCLQAFNVQQTTAVFEVILVGDVAHIVSRGWSFKLVLIEEPERHANVRRNAGLRIASANLIAFMDDDAMPDAHWVDTALAFNVKYPHAVLTGPERPVSQSVVAVTSHQVLSSPLSELHRGHTNTTYQRVKWHELPFCNCVIPKALLTESGGLNTSIPWDMDDFHFFFPYRQRGIFYNLPELTIRHDRYPDTLMALLRYKWGLRFRTGEKLVTHAGVYWRIVPVVVAWLMPLVLLALLWVLPLSTLWVLPVLYIILLLGIALLSIQPPSVVATLRGIVILAGIHIITFTAIHVGCFKQLLVSTLGRANNPQTVG